MHFLAIPNNLIDDIKSEGRNGMSSRQRCGVLALRLLGTGDGRWFVMVAKAKLKKPKTIGGWHGRGDDSKYGMPVPDLQDMFDDDPEF